MLKKKSFKITELVLLFFALPLLLFLNIPLAIEVGLTILGIFYCLWVAVKEKLISIRDLYQMGSANELPRMGLTFAIIVPISMAYMYFLHPDDLFIVVKENFTLWLFILFVYSIVSAYPQELIYRKFFYRRYEEVFKSKNQLILLNILAFPLAHLFFENGLVLLVTFVGGILFNVTYLKSRSVLLTSIEHAIYGNWLFTIGMGEMLAFPMPK